MSDIMNVVKMDATHMDAGELLQAVLRQINDNRLKMEELSKKNYELQSAYFKALDELAAARKVFADTIAAIPLPEVQEADPAPSKNESNEADV